MAGMASTTATTFFCHGLYAVGFYPQPGEWVVWIMEVFRLSEPMGRLFLKAAGMLDFVVAVGFVIKTQRHKGWTMGKNSFVPLCLWGIAAYACFWGFATALGRLVGPLAIASTLQTFDEYWFEMAVRLVHGGVPLVMLWLTFAPERNVQSRQTYPFS